MLATIEALETKQLSVKYFDNSSTLSKLTVFTLFSLCIFILRIFFLLFSYTKSL